MDDSLLTSGNRTKSPLTTTAFGASLLVGACFGFLAFLPSAPHAALLALAAGAILALASVALWRSRARLPAESPMIGHAEVQAIQECSPVGVFFADLDGSCKYANGRFLEISGLAAEEARGHGWRRILHPEDREWVSQEWQAALQAQSYFEAVYRYLRPDGEVVWIACRAAPVNSGGALIGYAGAVEDITSQRASEERARNAHQRLSSTLESIHDGFLSLDNGWHITYINQAACEMFSKNRAEVVGSNLLELFPDIADSILVLYCREVMAGGQPQVFETQDSDDELWYEVRVYPAPEGVSVFYQDITARKQIEAQIEESMMQISEYSVRLELQQQELADANDKLEALATTDGLTGLKNHRTFQDRLSLELEASFKSGEPVSLLLLDVDKFKTFNDEFGHQAGDEVLIGVGKVLEQVAMEGEFVARYGGEEFVVILPSQSLERAVSSAERFRVAIESQEWPYRAVTASFGCSTTSGIETDKTTLISQADQALYVSKSRGRNRTTHFSQTREATSLAA